MIIVTHLLQETRISFTDLAREQGLAESTPWRWAKHGCNGVLLESFSIGARRFTTREAWERFVQATTTANGREELNPDQQISEVVGEDPSSVYLSDDAINRLAALLVDAALNERQGEVNQ